MKIFTNIVFCLCFWAIGASWAATDNFVIQSATLVEADSNMTVQSLKYCSKKYSLSARFSEDTVKSRVSFKQTVLDKKTGKMVVKTFRTTCDINQAFLYIKKVLRRMGVSRLPHSQDSVRLERLDTVDGPVWWLMISGSNCVALFYNLNKVRGSSTLIAEVYVKRLDTNLCFDSIKITPSHNAFVLESAHQIYYLTARQSYDYSKKGENFLSSCESIRDGAREYSVLHFNNGEDQWFGLNKGGYSVNYGKLLGVLSPDTVLIKSKTLLPDSLAYSQAACFWDDGMFWVVWGNNQESQSYYFGFPDSDSAIVSFNSRNIGRAKIIERFEDGVSKQYAWLGTDLVTLAADTFLLTKKGKLPIYIHRESSTLGCVDTSGIMHLAPELRDLDLKFVQPVKMSDYASGGEKEDDFTQAIIEDDEDLVILDCEDDKGAKVKRYFWPERNVLTEYYGQPLFARDSLLVFRSDTQITVPSKELDGVIKYYYLKRCEDKKFLGTKILRFDSLVVAEVSYNSKSGEGREWIWLQNGYISTSFGRYYGRAKYNSQIMIFVNWDYLSFVSTGKWWSKSYNMPKNPAKNLYNDLDKFSVNVYVDRDYGSTEEYVAARIVYCVKNEQKKWAIDETYRLAGFKPND